MIEEIDDTPKLPPPSVSAARDADGDWHFRIIGARANEPDGERYRIEIYGREKGTTS